MVTGKIGPKRGGVEGVEKHWRSAKGREMEEKGRRRRRT